MTSSIAKHEAVDQLQKYRKCCCGRTKRSGAIQPGEWRGIKHSISSGEASNCKPSSANALLKTMGDHEYTGKS